MCLYVDTTYYKYYKHVEDYSFNGVFFFTVDFVTEFFVLTVVAFLSNRVLCTVKCLYE